MGPNSINGASDREEKAEQLARELRAKFQHLRGQRISIGAAARKYGVAHQTLSRWAQKGIIAVLGKQGKKKMLDEADVAYAAEVYHTREAMGPTSGAKIFDEKGRPYVLRFPDLARYRRKKKEDGDN